MNKDKALETAEKLTTLSISLFEITLQTSQIIAALELIQENVRESASLITEVIKELPAEVQEKLRVIKAGDVVVDKDAARFVDWVRKMLKGGA